GVWAGAALERSLAGGALPRGPMLALGVWVPSGQVALGFSIEQTIERAQVETVLHPEGPVDTLGAPIVTLIESRHVRATSASMSARWERRRVTLVSVAGITVNQLTSPRRWMQTSCDVALMPRLALYATAGKPAPRWLALDPGLGRQLSVGLKLTGAVNAAAAEAERVRARSTELELKGLDQGWYVIRVRARSARAVEVMGDFSAWQPVALRHVHGSQWALAVQLEPGVHHVQVRVDGGAWKPPDGIPGASDGFNGDVGVLVAR
ncbi:MAG TPA: glycogen-binding domain-containing protein, partial [Candidatus Eisenbacteria bacterium]|nr:glycogen-binding domain-containing protein [Candidatus Eisenbacteria bacterium]